MKIKRIFTLLTALVIVFRLTASAHATLIDRGGGLIYDDDLNITWLQDANYAQTSGFDADGLMSFDQAVAWANGLVYGGFDDWRLPTSLNQNGSGPCISYNCTGSEMGHLYYVELGNPAGGPFTNTGPFTNLQDFNYWSGTLIGPPPFNAWFFAFSLGYQNVNDKDTIYYAWAVRNGDVATVPEPATLLLLGSGLAGLGLWGRKRFKGIEA